MDTFVVKYRKYILAAIIILSAVLIFSRLTRADIQHDDATYSFRAIGYLDYMDADRQTTPIDWFDKLPWWSRLSFHDHPPLVFFIQHLFFKLFGLSDFVARLPFALAGVGSVLLLYFIAKNLYDFKTAMLSTFILAISSYHTWISRIGYLDGIALFFILLTLHLLILGLKKPTIFIWFGISLGLTLLTKYTTFFILPVIFLYILIKKKQLFNNRYFIYSIVIAVLIFSPVIIYNLKMFQARGHFDLQFTLLLGQSLSDWPTIGAGGISSDYLNQTINFFKGFLSVFSLTFYLLIIGSLIHIKGRKNLLIALILLFMTIEFILLGPNVRYTTLITPFLAMVVAVGLINTFRFITLGNKFIKIKKIIYFIVLIFVFGFELFYNLNTNTFYQPLGLRNKHYSAYRWENIGFKQLENYLIKEENFNESKKAPINAFEDLTNDASALKGGNVYIYDPSAKWFPTLWYLRRYAIYYNNEFISMSLLDDHVSAEYWKSYTAELGVKNIYLIRGVNSLVYDPGVNTPANQEWVENIVSIFKTFDPELKEIYNSNNQLVFNVYKLRLDI